MTSSEIRIGGAVVFWSPAELSDHQLLCDGLEDKGLKDYAPAKRTNGAALKDAVAEVCNSSRQLIRPLAASTDGTEGFCVMEEERGKDANEYRLTLTAKIDQHQSIYYSPWDERATKINIEFKRQLGLIRPAQVTGSLTGIIGHLGGVSLRPKGSIYWLESTKLDVWQELSTLVEGCAVKGKSSVYMLKTAMDYNALKAVSHAIINEVVSEVTRIDEEITNGELGNRALENRRVLAEAMHAKIKEYEKVLAISLDGLHQQLEQTELAIGKACMMTTVEAA